MAGITDLDRMLATLDPTIREGEFVYATVSTGPPAELDAEATIREAEGITLVLRRDTADAAGIGYEFVASWITLTVHSSLAAVGLTAAFSAALGDAGISCNVLAGFYHDHILVPSAQRDAAVAVLQELAVRHQQELGR
jgi:uncharacterized protein